MDVIEDYLHTMCGEERKITGFHLIPTRLDRCIARATTRTWYFLMLSSCSLVGSVDDMVTIVLLLMLACWSCCLMASDRGGGGGGGCDCGCGWVDECLSAGTAEPFWNTHSKTWSLCTKTRFDCVDKLIICRKRHGNTWVLIRLQLVVVYW